LECICIILDFWVKLYLQFRKYQSRHVSELCSACVILELIIYFSELFDLSCWNRTSMLIFMCFPLLVAGSVANHAVGSKCLRPSSIGSGPRCILGSSPTHFSPFWSFYVVSRNDLRLWLGFCDYYGWDYYWHGYIILDWLIVPWTSTCKISHTFYMYLGATSFLQGAMLQ
jgi:hypothetical protein